MKEMESWKETWEMKGGFMEFLHFQVTRMIPLNVVDLFCCAFEDGSLDFPCLRGP